MTPGEPYDAQLKGPSWRSCLKTHAGNAEVVDSARIRHGRGVDIPENNCGTCHSVNGWAGNRTPAERAGSA